MSYKETPYYDIALEAGYDACLNNKIKESDDVISE
jgi:hypothetical protein